jgi:hypothetical protein
MTTLVEGTHPGGFLVWEALPRLHPRDDHRRARHARARHGAGPNHRQSGKYAAHDPAAVDGTETAVAVLWGKADASGGDAPAVAVVRGPAIVNRHDLVFAGTPSEGEIAAAHTALLAAGILVR